jgi:hypothetical protein
MLEVAEHPTRLEAIEDLRVDRALACVVDVVNRKAGHHHVEAAEVGQRLGEVMTNKLHALLLGEPLARGSEHRLGDVEPDAGAVSSLQAQQSKQAPITGAEVEDPTGVAWHVI